MGLLDRLRGSSDGGQPPERGECSCSEHVEQLADVSVPVAAQWLKDVDDEPTTVGQLVELGAIDVERTDEDHRWMHGSAGRLGPFHWNLWVGDEARLLYDDDAPLQLDEAILAQPGVLRVEWEDREVLWLGTEGLCEDGVLAAVARALADPRVRLR